MHRKAGDAPLSGEAFRGSLAATAIVTSVALAAATVRILPWLVDDRVPWAVAMPFARSVATLALEAGIAIGAPLGVAFAAMAFVERGEARVLATLGERPSRTAMRVAAVSGAAAIVLAMVSALGARDARAPGRVAAELLREGRASCASVTAPASLDVPLLGATWLCTPGETPVLAGRAPGSSRAIFTAHDVHLAEDLRAFNLDGAWLAFGTTTVHIGHAEIRVPPFVRASSVPPWLRASALGLAAWLCSLAATWLLVRRVSEPLGARSLRLHAIALGASGPLAALALLRALERVRPDGASLWPYALVPIAGILAVAAVSALLQSLPGLRTTASKDV